MDRPFVDGRGVGAGRNTGSAAGPALPASGYSRTSSLVPGTSFLLTEVDWTNTV